MDQNSSVFSRRCVLVERKLRDRAVAKEKRILLGKSVEGTIELFLPLIEEVKKTLTWEEIAAVFAEEGVAWKNGRLVSGNDLRSIVYRLRLKRRAAGQPIQKLDSQVSSISQDSDRHQMSEPARLSLESLLRNKTQTTKEKDATGNIAFDRDRLLREMARAAAERQRSKAPE